jgi:hypothetical protein
MLIESQDLELLKQVVEVKSRIHAEEHPDRLASQHALARAYQTDGQTNQEGVRAAGAGGRCRYIINTKKGISIDLKKIKAIYE